MTWPVPRSFPYRLVPALAAAASAAAGAAALPLPWWRADRGALLLDAEPVRELPPDVWTGVAAAGPWAAATVAVPAAVAVVAALLACAGSVRRGRPSAPAGADAADATSGAHPRAGRSAVAALWVGAGAGLAAVAVAVRTLVQWGPSGAWGAWLALVAGVGAVVAAACGGRPARPGREGRVPAPGVARSGPAGRVVRTGARRGVGGAAAAATVAVVVMMVVVAVVMVAAVAAVPDGPARLPAPAGPFVPVAAVGAFPLRSGATGLAASDDARPVLADGAAGVVSRAGVVVAVDGRARVLARLDPDAPAPIGMVGDRVVRWISADSVAVTALRPPEPGDGPPVDVVVRGVTEAGLLGADGSVWLRSDADPSGTVRRLDVARLDGTQRIAATWLPVVTIREPEPPVDLRTILPVPGGGLRALAGPGRLELLTGTAAGIAITPLAGTRCGAAGVARLDRTAADRSGVWFVLVGADGERLAHLGQGTDGSIRTVATLLPGTVTALTAPGDGSVLVLSRSAQGTTLWRLPDAAAALDAPGTPPVTCPPGP